MFVIKNFFKRFWLYVGKCDEIALQHNHTLKKLKYIYNFLDFLSPLCLFLIWGFGGEKENNFCC